MVIEREISGPQFIRDVRVARDYIEGLRKRPAGNKVAASMNPDFANLPDNL
jgi:hypothetical protein